MGKTRLLDLLILVVIVVAGVVTAWIAFGILESQASLAGKGGYQLGGAVAGAVIAWSVLTSLYLQIRRSSGVVEDLRNRNLELTQKLIRGAPCPNEFDTDVSERHKIVVARPVDWVPVGGTIFDMEVPPTELKPGDHFPSRFRCTYTPITPEMGSRDEYYASIQTIADVRVTNKLVESFTAEMIGLGDPVHPVKAIKVIERCFLRIEETRTPGTGQIKREWSPLSKSDFAGGIYFTEPSTVRAGVDETKVIVHGSGFSEATVCLIDDQEVPGKFLDERRMILKLGQDQLATPRLLKINVLTKERKVGASEPTFLQVIESSGESADDSQYEREREAPSEDSSSASDTRILFLRAAYLRVECYHPGVRLAKNNLGTLFIFEFWDDEADFVQASERFNQILFSTRFLV